MAAVNVALENASSAKVDAWIDFDRDGVWEANEKILDSIDVFNSLQTLNYNLPTGVTAGDTFARVRVSSAGTLEPTGPANDGEVEDYRVTILPPPIVESVIVNHGDQQRSSVYHVTVTFDRVLDVNVISGDPFRFTNTETNETAMDVAVVSELDNKTVVDFSFTPGPTVTDSGSLADGNYQFVVDASLVSFGVHSEHRQATMAIETVLISMGMKRSDLSISPNSDEGLALNALSALIRRMKRLV